jgi:signal transduction histidine kinase/DNA-binding response OmpR family regulator/ligand-binding sensor domain-containing protein
MKGDLHVQVLNRKCLRTLFVCVCYLLLFPDCQAQFTFQFEHLDIKGLANDNITSIIEDSKGFMWVGTGQGLYRYDGYSFDLHLIDPDHKNKLTANTINCLFEDNAKKIWVGTADGLFQFDPVTEKFKSYFGLTERHKISKPIKSIVQDSKGNIWFTTETEQSRIGSLVFFDQQNNRFEKFNYDGLLNWPRTIIKDEFKNFWIACDKGIVIFNPATKSIVKHITTIWKPSNLDPPVSDLSSVFYENNGNIWATAYNGGISKVAYDSSYTIELTNLQKRDGLASNCIMTMTKDRQSNYWIATLDGITVYNTTHGTILNLAASDDDPYSIRDSFCKVLMEDKSGNIWIGYPGAGLSKSRPNKGFLHLTNNIYGTNVIGNNIVHSVYVDHSDNIWLGVVDQGVQKINFNSNFKKQPEAIFFPLKSRAIWSIERLEPNKLLVATEDKGLFVLNESTKQIQNITTAASFKVRKLPDGSIFIFEGRRVYKARVDRKNHTFMEMIPDSSTRNRTIWPEYSSLTQEDTNHYWLSTWQGDIYRYNSDNDRFTIPKINPGEPVNISHVHIDKKKFLWVTAFEGTFKYKIERQTNDASTLTLVRKYTEKDGLVTKNGASNLFTAALAEDHHGNLWLGQAGLTMLSPESHQTIVYDEDDGLPSIGITQSTAATMKSGHIVFGTNKGAFLFHPDSLKNNIHPPPVVITDIKLLNKVSILSHQQYEIKHNENVITLEFSALDFTAPEKNQYAYQLIGFDPDWVYSANGRNATYTNLDPGTYTFKVKGSNNDGVWNEEGTSVKITILPPPWKTWWAYSGYSLAFMLLLAAGRNEIIKRERLKTKAKLKEAEAEKYHELDTLKSRFFANISHEFRTPLTLLLGPLEKRLSVATESNDKAELSIMHRNASRLLTLVNQLLDLSRLEAGTLSLKVHKQSLNNFIPSIASQFSSMADSKAIHFEVRIEDTVELYFDPDKLEKIITNLLSNAFKFTPSGGAITVSISQHGPTVRFNEGYAEIKIADSGPGIEKEHIEKIFDRFYQADTSSTRNYEGSGIGLALTKELVELHHGIIGVTSTPGTGTCFTIQFPLGSVYLKPSDIVNLDAEIRPSGFLPKTTLPTVDLVPSIQEDGLLPNILIVEDNADLRFYLQNSLRDKYKIQEAADGELGFTAALENVPDLIISDLMMPKMDGMQLCEKLKTDERTSHIPIILLTAKADIETKLDGLHMGADDYMAKPFDGRELEARIYNLIENRRKLQDKFSKKFNLSATQIKVESLEDRFLKKVKGAIETRMDDHTLGVESLAEEVAMSTIQLYRKLKAITGQTPNELIRNIRLDRAASLLRQHSGNVSEVAYEVGFNNLSYFAKCFKEKFGVSPSEYK